MLAGAQRRQGDGTMQIRPGTDDHGSDLFGLDQFAPVGVRPGNSKFSGHPFRRFLALVANRYNFHALLVLQARYVPNACIVPGADNADTNDFRHGSVPPVKSPLGRGKKASAFRGGSFPSGTTHSYTAEGVKNPEHSPIAPSPSLWPPSSPQGARELSPVLLSPRRGGERGAWLRVILGLFVSWGFYLTSRM